MGDKKVLVSGCYDLLHAGHIAFFKTASQYGKLYVSVGKDDNLFRLKGKKPYFTQEERVYMVGDNPASDIAGGNNYESPHGTDWASILVSTGVYVEGTTPAHQPRKIVGDVWDAVTWATAQEKWSRS